MCRQTIALTERLSRVGLGLSLLEQFANGPERGRLGGSAKCPLSSSRSCETKWNLSQKRRGLRRGSMRLGALWYWPLYLACLCPSGEQVTACLCKGPGSRWEPWNIQCGQGKRQLTFSHKLAEECLKNHQLILQLAHRRHRPRST